MYAGYPALPPFPHLVGLIVYTALVVAAAVAMPTLLRRSRVWSLPYLLLCLYGLGQCIGGVREGKFAQRNALSHASQYPAVEVAWETKIWQREFASGLLYGIVVAGGLAGLIVSLWRVHSRGNN